MPNDAKALVCKYKKEYWIRPGLLLLSLQNGSLHTSFMQGESNIVKYIMYKWSTLCIAVVDKCGNTCRVKWYRYYQLSVHITQLIVMNVRCWLRFRQCLHSVCHLFTYHMAGNQIHVLTFDLKYLFRSNSNYFRVHFMDFISITEEEGQAMTVNSPSNFTVLSL